MGSSKNPLTSLPTHSLNHYRGVASSMPSQSCIFSGDIPASFACQMSDTLSSFQNNSRQGQEHKAIVQTAPAQQMKLTQRDTTPLSRRAAAKLLQLFAKAPSECRTGALECCVQLYPCLVAIKSALVQRGSSARRLCAPRGPSHRRDFECPIRITVGRRLLRGIGRLAFRVPRK